MTANSTNSPKRTTPTTTATTPTPRRASSRSPKRMRSSGVLRSARCTTGIYDARANPRPRHGRPCAATPAAGTDPRRRPVQQAGDPRAASVDDEASSEVPRRASTEAVGGACTRVNARPLQTPRPRQRPPQLQLARRIRRVENLRRGSPRGTRPATCLPTTMTCPISTAPATFERSSAKKRRGCVASPRNCNRLNRDTACLRISCSWAVYCL